jgi:hypothetical protein
MKFKIGVNSYFSVAALLAGLVLPLCGQSRVSDGDLERFIKNLHEDAKSFRPVFENALKKSTIRKTSQEKDAKITAERLEKQTDAFADNFKRTHKGETDLPLVVSTAQQIDGIVHDTRLNPETVNSWRKVKADLDEVTNAFNAPPAFGPPR